MRECESMRQHRASWRLRATLKNHQQRQARTRGCRTSEWAGYEEQKNECVQKDGVTEERRNCKL